MGLYHLLYMANSLSLSSALSVSWMLKSCWSEFTQNPALWHIPAGLGGGVGMFICTLEHLDHCETIKNKQTIIYLSHCPAWSTTAALSRHGGGVNQQLNPIYSTYSAKVKHLHRYWEFIYLSLTKHFLYSLRKETVSEFRMTSAKVDVRGVRRRPFKEFCNSCCSHHGGDVYSVFLMNASPCEVTDEGVANRWRTRRLAGCA